MIRTGWSGLGISAPGPMRSRVSWPMSEAISRRAGRFGQPPPITTAAPACVNSAFSPSPASCLPPLTDWMCTTIDATAGLREGPLTFGHLWGERATAVHQELRRRQQARERLTSKDWRRFQPDIDLKVMTTNLTLRKPYEFPFSQPGFYYCPECWRLYFPAPVLAHLERTSVAAPAEATIRSRSPPALRR